MNNRRLSRQKARSNHAAVDSTLEPFPDTCDGPITVYSLKVKGVCPPITPHEVFSTSRVSQAYFPIFIRTLSGYRLVARSTERILRSAPRTSPLPGIIPLGSLDPQRPANWIRMPASWLSYHAQCSMASRSALHRECKERMKVGANIKIVRARYTRVLFLWQYSLLFSLPVPSLHFSFKRLPNSYTHAFIFENERTARSISSVSWSYI